VAVQRFMTTKYHLDKSSMVNSRVRTAIRSAMARGLLLQVKGNGASGSFKLTPEGKALAKDGPKIAPKPRGRPAATTGRKDVKKATSTPRKPKVDAKGKKGKSVKTRPPTPMVPSGRATAAKRGAKKSPAKRPRVAKPKKAPTKVQRRSATPKHAVKSKSVAARKSTTPRKGGRSKSATPKRAVKSQSGTPRRAVASRSGTPRRASDSVATVGKRQRR
jgi:hypothetical protein